MSYSRDKVLYWIADDIQMITLLNNVIGNAGNAFFPCDEDLFSLRTLMKLAYRAQYVTPAQQIILEDAATCVFIKLLHYANTSVLKNFELYLQQESCPSKCAETRYDYVEGASRGET